MRASSSNLKKLDVGHHAALLFVTCASAPTHHCKLYEIGRRTLLCLRRNPLMVMFVAKALLGKLPQYMSSLLTCS